MFYSPYYMFSKLQVLAILCVTDHHNRDNDGAVKPLNNFLVVTTDLIKAKKARADPYLPQPLLQYQKFCLVLATFVVVDMFLLHKLLRQRIFIDPLFLYLAQIEKLMSEKPQKDALAPKKGGNHYGGSKKGQLKKTCDGIHTLMKNTLQSYQQSVI